MTFNKWLSVAFGFLVCFGVFAGCQEGGPGSALPAVDQAQSPKSGVPPTPAQNKNCLARSCGDSWLLELSHDQLMRLSAGVERQATGSRGLNANERVVAQSSIFANLLALQIGEEAAEQAITSDQRSKESYVWLFEEFLDDKGEMHGLSERKVEDALQALKDG